MTVEKSPEDYWPANDHPRWNQSVYFNFYDPAQRIGCFIRVGILENLGETNSWFVFFKDGKPLFNRTNMNLPYTSTRLGLGDGLEVAGMRLRSVEPLSKAHVTFDERDFKVDLGGGESGDVRLVVNRIGTYDVHCSHFMHSIFGMKGKIVVR